MSVKKHIPNLFTLGNLLSGTLAILYVVEDDFKMAAFMVILGIVFDFFDGFLARLLGVSGELGKQLDSLADMVTSGVVPGILMLKLIPLSTNFSASYGYLSYLGLLLTLAAAYRLAKFNIDTRQSDSFIGLPTPAMSLFVVSLPLIKMNTGSQMVLDMLNNQYVLIGITLVLAVIMNIELRLFSLKMKNYGLKDNWIKYLFLVVSVLLIVTLHYLSVPLIIILYVLVSAMMNSVAAKTN